MIVGLCVLSTINLALDSTSFLVKFFVKPKFKWRTSHFELFKFQISGLY